MNADPTGHPARLSKSGPIAIITLDRPKSYNVIDRRMAECLRDLATDVARDDTIRAVVVRGEGTAFCAGGDIRYMIANLERIGDAIRDLLGPYHEFLELLRQMPKLTIASVHGSAAGAGLSLASMCDLCIATTDVRFTPAYKNIGVSPDGGGTYGLTRAVGARRALQIFLAEDSISGEQAERWGLVSKLVAPDALEAETIGYVERLLQTSPEAIKNTKRLINRSLTVELHDHLIDEMEDLVCCMGTDVFKSAVKRFVDKR